MKSIAFLLISYLAQHKNNQEEKHGEVYNTLLWQKGGKQLSFETEIWVHRNHQVISRTLITMILVLTYPFWQTLHGKYHPFWAMESSRSAAIRSDVSNSAPLISRVVKKNVVKVEGRYQFIFNSGRLADSERSRRFVHKKWAWKFQMFLHTIN